ncbi:MAG TPA: enoyl-CoA hydratase-related protein [Candidatus Angelobacter sp.]
MDFTEIRFERQNRTAIITFNRPEARNCIGPIGRRELTNAWRIFRDDPELCVAILTGEGDQAFCAGADLKAVETLVLGATEISQDNSDEEPGILGPSRWTNIYKPIIAAINGVAFAGGLEWACFADIRIAEEHAQFGVTCRRWNIGLGDGGTQRLPRIVGLGRALDLIITGRVINARDAEQIGLVNSVVAKGQGLPKALELADFVTSLPQEAIRTDKEAVIRGFGESLNVGLRIEAECFNKLSVNDLVAGASRFTRKEHPDQGSSKGFRTPGLVTSSQKQKA